MKNYFSALSVQIYKCLSLRFWKFVYIPALLIRAHHLDYPPNIDRIHCRNFADNEYNSALINEKLDVIHSQATRYR